VGEADDEVDQPSLAIRVAGVDVDIAVDRPLDISVEGRLTAGATSIPHQAAVGGDGVDRLVDELGTTWSAFTREALRWALGRRRTEIRERRHRAGYERLPVEQDESLDWRKEQIWPD
jgi:hypothetical protein